MASSSATYSADDLLSTESYDLNGNVLSTGGRSFTYDSENRLAGMNGGAAGSQVAIQYDGWGNRVAVGNRLSETSSLHGLASGLFSYNADDLQSSETYDANGNVLTTGGRSFSYDSENQLISMNGGTVALQYDGDGDRVAETVGAVTTRYLVDDLNPTGYAQVVEELINGSVKRQYSYGLQRIDENQIVNNTWTPSFYGYDGEGSVRLLTNIVGTATDTYSYDAFGSLVNSNGTTPNNYLYRGEQYDPALALYYLRARYVDPATGSFMGRDPRSGNPRIPGSLHRYIYASGNPVNRIDPSGRNDVVEYRWITAILATGLVAIGVVELEHQHAFDRIAHLLGGLPIFNQGGSAASPGSRGGSGTRAGPISTPANPLPPQLPHGCNGGGTCRGANGSPVDSWQSAEQWLNEKYGGDQQARLQIDGQTRIIDNLTPDRIAQEAKFGEQSLESIKDQAQLDLDLKADGQISGVQWWFFTSAEGGAASANTLQWLYAQGIEVFVDGVEWAP